MKKIIITGTLVILLLGLISLTRDTMNYHFGKAAFALCTTEGIINDCCFKFFKVLEGDVIVNDLNTKEKMAVAEFKRCLRRDIGCSVEMTELKSKSIKQVRNICK